MPCPDDRTLLMFVDDELDAPEHDAIRQHLAACGACREAIAEMRSVNQSGRSALRRMRVNTPLRAIHPRRLRLPRQLVLAATIAIVVVSVTVWLSIRRDDGGVARTTQAPPSSRPHIAANGSRPAPPPLLDEQFERWAAEHRKKRVELLPLEEVAVFRPPQILPFDPEVKLQVRDYGVTP